ncbi:ninein-like protein isoform X2 [Lampris incognitus]|uniref:ninein-like protein isoform X2 n=1 Tax=Lampris incognitus TaxID=2546036 RepID=UPI0024B4C849|nr:ninein-like protein isoform X2 [Lampris incognitus]
MEEAEQNRYVAQLKVEFDSCDTTATGYLDQDELTTLCHKLHLDAHLPLLLDTLLGEQRNARVNFEEFKEGFVSVLSRSLDISTSEEDSSYMEPVVPEEVKPKFVKGTKRYGRRSRPDSQPELQLSSASDEPPFRTNQDSPLPGVRRAKLRRSTSLESVESLKSDEETGSQKGNILSDLDVRGQQVCWKEEISDPPEKVIAGQMKEMWDELGGGGGGGGGGIRKGGEVSLVCEHLGLQHLDSQELEALLRKSDADWDGRVGLRKILCGAEPVGPSPISSSTPVRPSVTQRGAQKVEEGRLVRSTSPSLLSATVGQRLLSQLDDGTGSTSPEQVITLWSEEGIHNSRNVLQTLDFSLEEKLSLVDLTLALDNELLVSGNGIHQAALISYKNEIQYLQLQAEQASRERDKVKTDLDRADRRNLQLVREVDDHHTTMETLNQTKIRELEQEFRDRLTALRSESELESEVLLQQAERDRVKLQEEVKLLRLQEVSLQGELCCSKQEKRCLEEEVTQVKMKLCEAETCVSRLQRELDQLLQDKYGSLDPASAGLKQEEHFSKVIREYEHQCRELQDKNDELSSELLKSLAGSRKSRRSSALDWSSCRSLTIESDSDDTDLKRGSSPLSSRKPPLSHDQNNLGSLESLGGPAISIETELAMEQLRQKHSQEIQDLKIQLETKVNFYERSLELMKQNMEIERKDICQSFKLEISELEEQRTQAEETLRELEEKLQKEIQKKNVDQEWRVQREQVEMEQNFALEISHLVQRLTSEKDQLEAELKLKMDQEVMSVRVEMEEQISQMKLQHMEAHQCLLHQLHQGRWQLEENQSEKLQNEERLCNERRKMKECNMGEVCKLKEGISSLQEALMRTQDTEEESCQRCSESEAELEQVRSQSGRLESELRDCPTHCTELEVKLEANLNILESQRVFNQRLSSDKCLLEEEVVVLRSREEVLHVEMSQLRQELKQQKEESENSSWLSNGVIQQETKLRTKEQTADGVRPELDVMRSNTKHDSTLTSELVSLRTDRARLVQDLKDQAMVVDMLQLELDSITEEVVKRRSAEECLQVALKEEQASRAELQSSLDEKDERIICLSQERSCYVRMADQLSTQIVEMEAEICNLQDHIRSQSVQLDHMPDLLHELQEQLETKSSEVERLRLELTDSAELLNQAEVRSEEVTSRLEMKEKELCLVMEEAEKHLAELQQALRETRAELQRVEEAYEGEKSKMKEHLMEMEKLVITLEMVMDPASPHRTQLEEAQAEKGVLKEKLAVLQQEIQRLEEDLAKKKKNLDEMERQHEKSREEEERLYKENSKYRNEVLDLSNRNLQLSNENSELSAHLHGDQEAVLMLRERLETVSREQEEQDAKVRQLQELLAKQERENLHLQKERELMEREMNVCKEKLESKLSAVALKQQRTEEENSRLVLQTKKRDQQVEKLEGSLCSMDSEVEQLRTQLHAVIQEKDHHAQEVASQQRNLQEAQEKVEELEANMRRLNREKEAQSSAALQEDRHNLHLQSHELLQKTLDVNALCCSDV